MTHFQDFSQLILIPIFNLYFLSCLPLPWWHLTPKEKKKCIFKWTVSLIGLLVCHCKQCQETQPLKPELLTACGKSPFYLCGLKLDSCSSEKNSLWHCRAALLCSIQKGPENQVLVVGKPGAPVLGVFQLQFWPSAPQTQERFAGGMGYRCTQEAPFRFWMPLKYWGICSTNWTVWLL